MNIYEELNKSNYIVFYDWMLKMEATDPQIKLFALIYSFASSEDDHCCKVSQCYMAERLGMDKGMVSNYLSKMVEAGMINREKNGKIYKYSPNQIFLATLNHVQRCTTFNVESRSTTTLNHVQHKVEPHSTINVEPHSTNNNISSNNIYINNNTKEDAREKTTATAIMMEAFNTWYEKTFGHPYTFERDFTDNWRIIAKNIYDQMERERIPANDTNLRQTTEIFFNFAVTDKFRKSNFSIALIAKQINQIISQIINPQIISNEQRRTKNDADLAAMLESIERNGTAF